MSLLRNGHRLRSNSYFQNTLYHRHLGEKTSMDNMEDRPRQQRGTLATRNTRTDRSNNKQERSYKGKTRRKLSEKETVERRLFNPRRG